MFDSARAYDARFDVRDWKRWQERLGGEPEGALWVIIGPRRSGKTWALRALASLEPRHTAYIDLKSEPSAIDRPSSTRCLLLDEPGLLIKRDPVALVEKCRARKLESTRVLIAMTPAEWHFLADADSTEVYLKSRDRLTIPQLTPQQASKVARTGWAQSILCQLPSEWKLNPFLLELLLETAENNPELQNDISKLIDKTRSEAHQRFKYIHYVFEEGLSEDQRESLRNVARGNSATEDGLLYECGLVEKGPKINDPVIADYFRQPLVIHHISDIHFGPKSAIGVDAKETGAHGARLAQAAGGASIREEYLRYLAECGNMGPNAVIVSGDLVETGTRDQYESAREFLNRLGTLLSPHPDLRDNDPRVLVVGGNHDVDWSATRGPEGARRRHEAFAEFMADYPHPHLERAPEKRKLTFIAWPGVGVEIVLLGSAECGGEEDVDDIRKKLIDLIDGVVARARIALEQNELDTFDKLSETISRLDPGLVHFLDLQRVESHQWGQPVRLAVLHHPISPMPSTTEIARFAGLINAGSVKAALLRAGVSLVLHGHQHSGWFCRECWPGMYMDRELYVAAAPTLGSRETIDSLGFNELRVYREGTKFYEIEVSRHLYKATGWDRAGEAMSFKVTTSAPRSRKKSAGSL